MKTAAKIIPSCRNKINDDVSEASVLKAVGI
jgi:hypothetical protein